MNPADVGIDLLAIRSAQRVLDSHFAATRVVHAPTLSSGRRDVYLKLESELPTASFKVRGAVYALARNLSERPIGEVVAASTGNHGAAVAYAGRLLGVKATIFLPKRPNPVKAVRISELGGRIVETGASLSAAIDAAYEYCARTRAFFLHDAADADVPVGAATIGAELVAQVPSVDRVYVPMGDTALIRGVASAVKQLRPTAQIIGVVASHAPAYYLSWKAGRPVGTESADTIADGLAVTRPLSANVAAVRELVDRVIEVDEEEMLDAIGWLMTHEETIAEPAGAAATAGLRKENPPDGTMVTLITGANIAPEVLARVDAKRVQSGWRSRS
jgi:threonine dehydratase